MLKTIILGSLSVVIVGCSQNLWVKPGASQQDFGIDKYQCMQQAQQRVSGAYVNAYGGASSNRVITNEGLFNACMNSKGWSLQSSSNIEQSQAQNRQQAESTKYRQEGLTQSRLALCGDSRFEAYFAKTACKISDLSLAQLADGSRVTPAQKKAMDQLSPELNSINRETINLQQSISGKSTGARVSTLQSAFDADEKNRLNLYTGKITWGQYNTTRKEIAKDFATKMNNINQAK